MRLIDADALEKTICKWTGQYGEGYYYCGYDDALCAVQDLIADSPTVNLSSDEWISTDKCTPEPMKDVLVMFENGIMCVGFTYYDYRLLNRWSIHIDHALYQPCPINPKYWTLLPEPPKEGLKDASD